MKLQLLNAATATNSPPTTATAGFSLQIGGNAGLPYDGFPLSELDDCALLLKSTAGSGVMTVTVRLWAYSDLTAVWHLLGTNTVDANRGVLNEATAIGETGTADTLRFAQIVTGLRHFNRVYLEITAIGGTSTAVSAWLVCRS